MGVDILLSFHSKFPYKIHSSVLGGKNGYPERMKMATLFNLSTATVLSLEYILYSLDSISTFLVCVVG